MYNKHMTCNCVKIFDLCITTITRFVSLNKSWMAFSAKLVRSLAPVHSLRAIYGHGRDGLLCKVRSLLRSTIYTTCSLTNSTTRIPLTGSVHKPSCPDRPVLSGLSPHKYALWGYHTSHLRLTACVQSDGLERWCYRLSTRSQSNFFQFSFKFS